MKLMQCLAATVAAMALLAPNQAFAQARTVSQATLLAMVETDFSGGTQMSTIDNTVAFGDGVAYAVTWDDSGESFTRIVLQRENFDADFTGFSSFDIEFTPFAEDIGVKTFIQTGAGFAFFESSFISIATADGPTVVSLDLTGLPDLDLIQQFGYQIFGPGGVGVQSTVAVAPAPGASIPEPATALMALIAMGAGCFRRR